MSEMQEQGGRARTRGFLRRDVEEELTDRISSISVMIDHERRLLFIHIARTGGTSVETALAGNDWWDICPESKHISASQTRKLYGEHIWQSFVKFIIVRNPWDRLVSMWAAGWWWDDRTHLRGIKPLTFRDFVLTLRPHPNEHYDSLFYHQILDEKLYFVLRFETLMIDFSLMLKQLNLPDVILPHIQSRRSWRRVHYRKYFDNESASLVEKMFESDISQYGYSF